MKTFAQLIIESRQGAAAEAVSHHQRAAESKGEAEKYAEGSSEWHEHMADHHHAKMMAHRAEAKSKFKISDRTPHVKAADDHFSKAMKHHTKAG